MKKLWFCFLMILALSITLLIPVLTTSAASDALRPVTAFVSGEEYVLSISGINDYRGSFGEACLVGDEASEYGLEYDHRPQTMSAAKDCTWRITQKENGSFTFYSTSAKQYLNMEADKASLSSKEQELNAILSGAKITIFTEVDGTKYYLRFTNMYKTYSCWHAGTSTSSADFTMYSTQELTVPKEYDNTGKTPLFSVACFADLHIDYGIQSWLKPIRKSTVDAVNKLKKLGGADVILIGGDILSQNDRAAAWDNDMVKQAQDLIYETLMDASGEWWVLPVTGNHDSEPGVAAGATEYSGDWEPYLKEWVGDFDAVQRNENSAFEEILGYRYNLGGIDFICINTPYLPNRASGLYASQAKWLEKQLEEIGKDKTVIVTSHYPVLHAKYPMGTINGGDARSAFEAVLQKYPNVLYCYGHVHEGDSDYAWYSAGELIKPTGTSVLNSDNSYSTTGYVNCHMGSMGYYNTQFQPGGLLADEPQIVQFMKMDFYEDHITFNFYNTGEKSGDPAVYEIASYTIRRDMTPQLGGDSGSSDTPVDTETDGTAGTETTDSATVPTGTDGTSDAPTSATESNGTATEGEDGNVITVIVVALAAAVVLAGGAVLIVLLKKKP